MREDLIRRDPLLGIKLTNKEGLTGDAKAKYNLGRKGHEMVEFRIHQGMAKSKVTILDFTRAGLGL